MPRAPCEAARGRGRPRGVRLSLKRGRQHGRAGRDGREAERGGPAETAWCPGRRGRRGASRRNWPVGCLKTRCPERQSLKPQTPRRDQAAAGWRQAQACGRGWPRCQGATCQPASRTRQHAPAREGEGGLLGQQPGPGLAAGDGGRQDGGRASWHRRPWRSTYKRHGQGLCSNSSEGEKYCGAETRASPEAVLARCWRAAGTLGSVRGALRACRGRGVVPPSPRARPRAGLCPRQCVDVSGEEGPSVRALSASPPGPRGCWDEGQTSASRCRFRFQGAGRL